jgi:hypothetical protein
VNDLLFHHAAVTTLLDDYGPVAAAARMRPSAVQAPITPDNDFFGGPAVALTTDPNLHISLGQLHAARRIGAVIRKCRDGKADRRNSGKCNSKLS